MIEGKTGSSSAIESAAIPDRASSARVSGLEKDTRSARTPRPKTVLPPTDPIDPSVVPPTEPSDPPVVPPTDPVDPPAEPPTEPADPPVLPAAPGAIVGVACVSADMADVVTFDAPAVGGSVTSFALLRADSAGGSFVQVATATAESRMFRYSVEEPSAAVYAVVAHGPGGEGPRSSPVDNAVVSIATDVTSGGGTLRSSNGEVVLALAPGTFTSTTTVTIDEVAGTPAGGILSLAGVYRIEPSGDLQAPATFSVAYTLAVTHHQVSAALLKAACLMTYDENTGQWVSGARDVHAEAGYVTGTLDHFSEWVPGTIQPHGTSPESVDYCSGVCHDLETAVGSTLRYAARDSQVCYNCHGNPDLDAPPLGASGANVQSSFMGSSIISKHPVVTGGLFCTACHNPHADPAASPGLLRAYDAVSGKAVTTGTAYCWTCHGTVSNRTINALVPGYLTRTGGNKKTGFNGAHTASRASSTRYDTAEELRQGSTLGTQILSGGTVENTFEPVRLPKDPVAVPSPPFPAGAAYADKPYDGDASSGGGVNWTASTLGASAANGWFGSGTVTIDLGSVTNLSAFECMGVSTPGRSAHILEIQTSDTGLAGTFVPLVSQGQLGTGLPYTTTLTASASCRYVRFVFSRQFAAAGDRLDIVELSIFGPTPGTFTVQPEVARKATYGSGVVRWGATGPAATDVTVDARLSTNSGVTWSAWQPVTNGGSLMPDKAGSSLEYAQMELRTTLPGSPGATAALDWIEVATTRGNITGVTPQWTGESPSNECQRCHSSHGSENSGLVAAGSTAACINCHGGAFGGYAGAAQFGVSAHKTVDCAECHTSHGNATGSGATYAYLLNDIPRDACLECHTAVKAAFDAKQGVASERAKHDVYTPEQAISGSRLACRNCHATHSSANGLVNPDNLTQAYGATRLDPASIPTAEVVIYPSMDTILDATNPSFNYGQSPQGTITPTSRALFYFDLSVIPASATIQNATLVMWPSNPADVSVADHYVVYPITASWREGTGTGTLNDGAVNGATWLERENALSWAAPGGDRGAIGPYGVTGISPRNITDMVQALHVGPNYGLMVAPHDPDTATSLPIYMDEYAGANSSKYRPRLRVVYQTEPGTKTVLDDEAFCLKCHDNDLPFNLKGITGITRINTAWVMYSPHGAVKGIGPGYDNNDSGSLKAPYSWGMDPLPCMTCHDPHGSRLPFHLREVVNGRDMTPVLSSGWTSASAATVPAYFCGACHVITTSHPGSLDSPATLCAGLCHSSAH
ncbi:MAG: hypothetical protein CVT66_03955 [Actinobacteria bacterium HGW-Actinobacteria-6]|nr:MAG: hypothetical protein CVT66_03955 [Actinobacteria bacterium HGW-Actinobacteria-6]